MNLTVKNYRLSNTNILLKGRPLALKGLLNIIQNGLTYGKVDIDMRKGNSRVLITLMMMVLVFLRTSIKMFLNLFSDWIKVEA